MWPAFLITCLLSLFSLCTSQSLTDLPPCGQSCITSLLSAPIPGCPNLANGKPDPICLCSKTDSGFAIQYCAIQLCPAGTNTNAIIAYALAYCQAASASASAYGSSISSTTSTGSTQTVYTVYPLAIIVTLPTTISSSGSVYTSTFATSIFITTYDEYTALQGTARTLSTSIIPTATRPSTTSPSTTPPSTTTPSTTPTSTDLTFIHNGLSIGAKAGIGVGVGVSGVLAIAVLLVFIRRRKQATRAPKPELDAKDLPRTFGRAELEDKKKAVELDANDSQVQRLNSPAQTQRQ